MDTMLLELRFYGDDLGGNLDVKIVPAIQEGYVTKIVKDEDEKSRIYNFLEEISINVAINQEGKLQQKE